MSNQRRHGLQLVGAYVDRETHRDLRRIAEAERITVADLLRLLIDVYRTSYHTSDRIALRRASDRDLS